jgi:S1-C subfamily serine protease
VDIANRVVPQLIRDGHVPTPGIGIVAASEGAATRLGVEGIPIVRPLPGSSAALAGLQGIDTNKGTLGDVIVAANGKPVRRLSDLTDQLEEIGVGHTVQISVLRAGRNTTIEMPITDITQAR